MKLIKEMGEKMKNDDGFAIITTMLILSLLTFIGMSAMNNANFEIKIAGNEKQAYQRFFTADSGWKQSGPYLNTKALAPPSVNLTMKEGDTDIDWTEEYYMIIRNFSDGEDGLPYGGTPETPSATFDNNFIDGVIQNVNYWYRVLYDDDKQAEKFGSNYRDFTYEVLCQSEGDAQVTARVRKVFRVGY